MSELKTLRPEDREEYMRLRGIDTSTMTPPARAARFIYLNRYCFNGIYRTNLLGQSRNGQPYFNTSLFSPNALGTQGNASRRSFFGPGMDNYDMALHKITRLSESKTLEIRFETFNTFNHTQFFGPGAVNGNIDSATFGYVTQAASPRISQVAAKFRSA